jgi:hypothetical protein
VKLHQVSSKNIFIKDDIEGIKYKEETKISQNVSFETRPDPKEIYQPIDELEESEELAFYQLSQQTQALNLNKMDVENSRSLSFKEKDSTQSSQGATPSTTSSSQRHEDKSILSQLLILRCKPRSQYLLKVQECLKRRSRHSKASLKKQRDNYPYENPKNSVNQKRRVDQFYYGLVFRLLILNQEVIVIVKKQRSWKI